MEVRFRPSDGLGRENLRLASKPKHKMFSLPQNAMNTISQLFLISPEANEGEVQRDSYFKFRFSSEDLSNTDVYK